MRLSTLRRGSRTLAVVTGLLAGATNAQAQTEPTYIDGIYFIGAADNAQFFGDVVFGPNAQVYVEDGVALTFYGANVTIPATAQFLSYPGMNQTGTGKFVFIQPNPADGSTVQQTLNGGNTGGAAQPSLLNIEINNPMGVVLSGSDARITGNVQLTAGNLSLGTQDLRLDGDATITGYDNTKYVVTDGAGHLVKEDLANGSMFTFPIGRAANDYTPATLTNTSGAANSYFTAVKNYTESTSNEGQPQEGVDRSWQIYASGLGTATLALQHNDATNGSSFSSASAFVTQRTSGSGWTTGTPVAGTAGVPSGSVHTGSFSLSTNGSNLLSWFSKSSDPLTPLPVTLEWFKGSDNGCSALLSWKAADEKTLDRYKVEASADGMSYREVAEVVAQNQPGATYKKVVAQPAGKMQYRLRMVEKSGLEALSANVTVSTDCNKGVVFSVYPNPVNTNTVTVRYGVSTGGAARLVFTNPAGQVLIDRPVDLTAASGELTTDLSAFAAGVYFVQLSGKDWQSGVVKLIVTR